MTHSQFSHSTSRDMPWECSRMWCSGAEVWWRSSTWASGLFLGFAPDVVQLASLDCDLQCTQLTVKQLGSGSAPPALRPWHSQGKGGLVIWCTDWFPLSCTSEASCSNKKNRSRFELDDRKFGSIQHVTFAVCLITASRSCHYSCIAHSLLDKKRTLVSSAGVEKAGFFSLLHWAGLPFSKVKMDEGKKKKAGAVPEQMQANL